MQTIIEMKTVLIQYARLKQIHICEDYPLMRTEIKTKKYEKIDKVITRLVNGLITVDEAAEAIAKA